MALHVIMTAEGDSAVDDALTATEHEKLFLVIGAESRDAAFSAVQTAAPLEVGPLKKRTFRFEKYTGEGIEVTARYEEPEDDTSGLSGVISGLVGKKAKISFDTSGGTARILSTRERPVGYGPEPNSSPVKNPGFSVGWNGKSGNEAEFSGVDIVVPNIRKTVTQAISKPNTPYEDKVIELTGTVNDDRFLDREAGEVLFLGVSWQDQGDGPVLATYNFAIKKNETTSVHGIPIVKKGWEYVWDIIKTKKESDVSNVEVTVEGIFVSKVYQEKDFDALEIRT